MNTHYSIRVNAFQEIPMPLVLSLLGVAGILATVVGGMFWMTKREKRYGLLPSIGEHCHVSA